MCMLLDDIPTQCCITEHRYCPVLERVEPCFSGSVSVTKVCVLLVLCSFLVLHPGLTLMFKSNYKCCLFVAVGNGLEKENSSQFKELRNVAFGLLATLAVTAASPVIAANQVRNLPLLQFNCRFV